MLKKLVAALLTLLCVTAPASGSGAPAAAAAGAGGARRAQGVDPPGTPATVYTFIDPSFAVPAGPGSPFAANPTFKLRVMRYNPSVDYAGKTVQGPGSVRVRGYAKPVNGSSASQAASWYVPVDTTLTWVGGAYDQRLNPAMATPVNLGGPAWGLSRRAEEEAGDEA